MSRYGVTDAEATSCIVNRLWVDPRNGNVRFIDEMTQAELEMALELMKMYKEDPRVTELIGILTACYLRDRPG